MEKKYQVFVSSTYSDLKEERQEVIQALLELDAIPSGMELFPAADEDQWSLIKRVIDDCDYYIVIVGGRYGSLSAEGVSFTQKEYEYAVASGKPVMGFIHREPGKIASDNTEPTEAGKKKLAEFRDLVRQKMCKEWSTAAELGSVVSRSLVKLIRARPAVGWVKASFVSTEYAQELLSAKNRIDELEATLKAAKNQSTRAEDLAQGDDLFTIRFCYDVYVQKQPFPNNALKMSVKDDTLWNEINLSWNQIFARLGPTMLDVGTDEQLKEELSSATYSYGYSRIQRRHEGVEVKNFRVSANDFVTIKMQLKALGLIAKSDKKRRVNDNAAYWTLTPYGDELLTSLRAIKKEHRSDDELI